MRTIHRCVVPSNALLVCPIVAGPGRDGCCLVLNDDETGPWRPTVSLGSVPSGGFAVKNPATHIKLK